MMGSDFFYRDKIPVVVLGATGAVGQRFVERLIDHPWFQLVALAASERSVGKTYGEAVKWLIPTPLPKEIAEQVILPCLPTMAGAIAFSALDASVAGEIETEFAKAGFIVVSNARNHREDLDVPLLIPEVNPEHLALLAQQHYGKGKIITNPNCSATGLTLALKPLQDAFGLESVLVTTLQAISGAGYPGVPSLDILDNVVPFIQGEEEKVEKEPLKILGSFRDGAIVPAAIRISAQCNRVPVTDGHLACVSVKLHRKASLSEVLDVWQRFRGEPQKLLLPSAPEVPLHIVEREDGPQPKLHRLLDKGMAVSIGRLRSCPLLDFKFVLLSHNTIRGAVGGALLNAELLVRLGHVFW